MNRQPYLIIFYAILTLGAFLFGIMAWLFLPDMLADQLRSYVSGELSAFARAYTWKDCVMQIIRSNLLDLLRVYLCGLCLFGAPILIVFLFMKCFSIGFSACVLLQSSLILLLSRIIFLPVLIVSVSLGCRFAFSLIKNNMQNLLHHILRYSLLFLAIVLLVIMVSVLDGTINYYYLQQL